MQAWRAIGLAAGAPALIYLIIFHHFSCETALEQFTAGALGLAGVLAALRFA